MGRKKQAVEQPEPVSESMDSLELFARKDNRFTAMTEAASMLGDDKTKPKPAASGRAKNAVCKIRKDK